MKKIYMPSDEELERIQSLGANVYRYLLAKTAESIIADGINYPAKGMLKNAPKYVKEDENLVRAICSVFSEEMEYSEIASYDIDLLISLTGRPNDDSIYNLDNLNRFSQSLLDNQYVIDQTVKQLDKGLMIRPEYRFKYADNELLDSIFETRIASKLNRLDKEVYDNLSHIDPVYTIILPESVERKTFDLDEFDISTTLIRSIDTYARRYRVAKQPWHENLLDDEKTKRLIRCIKQNQNISRGH